MALQVYNTLTGKKEEFVPLEPGRVRMYVCGITVYDLCHIGHARSAVVFDVIYRYLLSLDYKVTYVRNFTDIDDKIIRRAAEEGKDYRTIADSISGPSTKTWTAWVFCAQLLSRLRPSTLPR